MSGVAPEALAALCGEVFGIELDPARVRAIAPQLETVLAEIKRLRALDLAAVPPAVVFDPECVYRDRNDD